jgi:hypothetical protein
MLALAIGVRHLPKVNAQSPGSCGYTRSTCVAEASSEQTSCNNACAANNPPGSAQLRSCQSSCATRDSQAVSSCTAAYNTCVTNQTNACKYSYCPSINACSNNGGLAGATWNDSGQQCVCVCNCPAPAPGCPNQACVGGQWVCYGTPILIDVRGEGFHLTSPENGVMFDFTGDGQYEQMAWTDPSYGNPG